MLFKLSLKNIKKSFKDYSVYFFTLIFAVAMFYMFNSMDAQESMLELNNSKQDVIKGLIFILNYVSVFVSIILGFLIVYSNNFLIKKRKKEIGLYFTLGMSKRKVNLILVLETIVIGIISLIIGLLCGVFLSQFISIFTAKLFEVNMTSFKFAFSTSAFNKTLLYFGLIFLLVMIFNVVTLSRYKLIDLLNGAKKSEKVKFRNKYVTVITFVLSICLIVYAYNLLFDHALLMMDKKTIIMLVCGAIGTFLLFFSLSGFLVKIVEHIKKVYYKGLNMFTLKQINSRINTTVISTTIICLMLLLTIGILSGSLSMASIFNDGLRENNLTDYSIISNIGNDYYINENGEEVEIPISFTAIDNLTKFDEFKKYSKDYAYIHKYVYEKLQTNNLMTQKTMKKLKKDYGSAMSFGYDVPIISETEYKNLMKLFGYKSIDIKDDEYLELANVELVVDSYSPFYKDKNEITINGHKLTPATDSIVQIALENSPSAGNDGVVVVSDEIVKDLELYSVSIVGNYVSNSNQEKLDKEFQEYLYSNINEMPYSVRTKIEMEASNVGVKAIVIFIGLYLGITFAITSATVLAIGQLSEASDNKSRYKVLSQIGSDQHMLNKSLLIQIAVSFVFPLIVALIHSYFGLKEINSLLISIGNIDLTSNILLTALFIVIVYGGYFLITYLCSKSIIKETK